MVNHRCSLLHIQTFLNKFEIMSLLLKNARHGYFFNDINLLIYLAVRNSDADLARFAQAEGATTTLTPEGYCSAIESIWGPRHSRQQVQTLKTVCHLNKKELPD